MKKLIKFIFSHLAQGFWFGLVWFGVGQLWLYSEYHWPRSCRKYFPGWVGWVVGKPGNKLSLAVPNLKESSFSPLVQVLRFGFVRFSLVWLGLAWFGLVWFGLVWFGMVCYCLV